MFPLTTRITHWLIVIAFIALVFTSLMNEFWYSKESIIESLRFSYPMLGLEDLFPDEELFIARIERRFGWLWHFWIGVFFFANFLIMFIYSVYIKRKKNKKLRNYMFILALIMFSTGLPLFFRSFITTDFAATEIYLYSKDGVWFISQGLIDLARSIHKYSSYLFVISVIAHIFNIIYKENTYNSGIVSKMINGGKK
jgi:Ni,Fe-hydrogenase I cytochrome b subunit